MFDTNFKSFVHIDAYFFLFLICIFALYLASFQVHIIPVSNNNIHFIDMYFVLEKLFYSELLSMR